MVYVSAVGGFEIEIKVARGKLRLPEPSAMALISIALVP